MPKFVGSLAALIALAAGILGHVEPIACLERALIAMIIGRFGCTMFYVLFMGRLPEADKKAGKDASKAAA
ncbi:MAG: hypothetical protein JSS72_02455 [Armatimonadetes bacterium]|nr:hypothetical protein [Armatimonadota bacterium]